MALALTHAAVLQGSLRPAMITIVIHRSWIGHRLSASTVGQSIPLDGTRMSLDYNSGRLHGYLGRSRFDIPLTEGLQTEALDVLERVTLSLWGTGF